jgi:uncharacterized protein involved in outer membrane biogenesis
MSFIKGLLKWIGIIVGVLIVILIIAAIALPRFLPLEKIKGLAAQKASEAIHRNVKIGKVSFNIFTGVQLNDLSVSNRPGFSKDPFISAGRIDLKYDLWKLLSGNIIIDKVVLIKPQILIETRTDGSSNYSDLVGVKKPGASKPVATKKGAVSIMVSKFAIENGVATMRQPDKVIQLKDLNLNLSGISLVTKKPMSLNLSGLVLYENRPASLSLGGNISLDMNKSLARLSGFNLIIAGQKISFNADISDFDKAPKLTLKVSSNKLDTNKFLAITTSPNAKPASYGVQTANINKTLKYVPLNLDLDASVLLQNVLYKEMKMDSVSFKAAMSNKVVKTSGLEVAAYGGKITAGVTADLKVGGIGYIVSGLKASGINAAPGSNDVIGSFLTKLPDYGELKNKISGTLDFNVSLVGHGIEKEDIIANSKGNGSFLLANGKISKFNSLAAIGEKLGLKTLQEDILLKEFKSNFSFANKIVNISKLALDNGDKSDVKIAFDGSANMGTLAFVKGNKLSLKLNPASNKLSSEYDAFKDENGWYSLDFEMTGSLKKPIPIPQLGKPVQQLMNNKKKELENAANKELEKQKQKAEQKAKQELEQKAKDLLKF